jgi:hypothetical protein
MHPARFQSGRRAVSGPIIIETTNSKIEVTGSDSSCITFEGIGQLTADQPDVITGTLEGLQIGDSIDLVNTEVTSAILTGNSLTITTSGGQPCTYNVSGNL